MSISHLPYCIYISRHPSGWFYAGKGGTEAVLAGKYKGSGVLICNIFKKYPSPEWDTKILGMYQDEETAYAEEALLVTEEFVAQEKCANLDTGGRHSKRHESTKRKISEGMKIARASEDKEKISQSYREARNRPEEKAARSASIKEAISSPEHRAKMSRVSTEASARPEVQAKRQKASQTLWDDTEMRDRINSARKAACGDEWRANLSRSLTGKSRRSFKVEIDGTLYKSMRAACLVLSKHPYQLRKLPTFKEIPYAAP
ncbi:hypothetical protein [Acinetobacter sp.]|uniref:hypothetical protein n=1 Tax=Acinetobacter sp. TaxID=472 RepID=UPI003890A96B